MKLPGTKALIVMALLMPVAIGVAYKQFNFSEVEKHAVGSAADYERVVRMLVASGRVREELRVIDAGGPTQLAALKERVDELNAAAADLAAATNQKALAHGGENVAQVSERVRAATASLDQALAAGGVDQPHAHAALIELAQLSQVLRQDFVRTYMADEKAISEDVSNLQKKHTFLLIVFAGVMVLILLWLAAALVAVRNAQQVARERNSAIADKEDKIAAMESTLAEMQNSLSTKGEFLSMVSHELRSPLQSILSSADTLNHVNADAQERNEAIQRIKRASMEMHVQLRDLLTLIRGEAGKLEMKPESFEVSEFVKDIGRVAAGAAASRGLRFTAHVPPEPVFAVADVMRISQVLVNLVTNAAKYLEVGEASITLFPPEPGVDELVFRITDTGPGIPKEALQRAFEPYSRVGAIRPNVEGSGMGLTVMSTVLRHLGGRFEVDSKEGIGTSFTVHIPALIMNDDDVHGETHSETPRILIVDDQTDVRQSLASLAKLLGYECDTASSAAIAANYLSLNRYTLVLIDLNMPVKNGLDLAAETRRGEGINADTYIASITADDRNEAGGSWPFNVMLEKPIETTRLKWAADAAANHARELEKKRHEREGTSF